MAQKSTTPMLGNSCSHEEPPVQVLNKKLEPFQFQLRTKIKTLGFHCGSGSGSKFWTQFEFQFYKLEPELTIVTGPTGYAPNIG
jgi:hypothetical protein